MQTDSPDVMAVHVSLHEASCVGQNTGMTFDVKNCIESGCRSNLLCPVCSVCRVCLYPTSTVHSMFMI